MRLLQGRRKAQKAGRIVRRAEWLEQLEVFGNVCAYCLRPAPMLEMDHVIPLSRGGEHTIDNLVPACSRCNNTKGPRGPLAMLEVA